jgi:uncharacterized protein DUF4388
VSLLGTVDTLALRDLFEVLAATRKTGAVHVRSEQGLGIVYFTGGKVCAGEAGHRSGPVDDGRDALTARLFDVCFELFRFEEASFEFEPEGRPTWPAADAVDVSEIVAETGRRLAQWAEIRATVPSLEARPRLLPDGPHEEVILEPAQWRVLAAIDGRRRISALIRVLDSSDFEICGRLVGLVEAGLVALDAPDPATLRTETEELAEPPVERQRWASPRPSRLAAVLDEDHWGSQEDGPDEVAMWDEQVLATTGGGAVRQQVRKTVRDTAPAAPPDMDAELPEILPDSSDEESEILTPS